MIILPFPTKKIVLYILNNAQNQCKTAEKYDKMGQKRMFCIKLI